MQFKSKNRRKVIINITSLIDVLFLLLIFFMVSSTFLEQPGIKLELPHAQSATIIEQRNYTLFVDEEGHMFLNDEEVMSKELEAKLKTALPDMKDSALVLKADTEASHGLVVRVMDIAKKAGVKKLVIGTKMEEE